ncbi:MAG: DTW domain-containing protein [Myxococcota bacterium]|jgi:DTW domain-containing protein|nr:DTW domain-containing protein [Myxococcota bacterium]
MLEESSKPQAPEEAVPAPGRETCYGCFKPVALCLCGRIPQVANRTRVTILQHPRERFHAIGTARIARLGLANAELLLPRAMEPRSLRISVPLARGSALLFPSDEAQELTELPPEAMPRGLVILDGTWSQARALLRENPALQALPRVRLSPTGPSRYRIRKEPRRHYVSTIEAIVQALRVIEPETPGLEGLLEAFDTMIDEQVVFRHRNPRRPLRKMARQAESPPGPLDSATDEL